MVFPLSHVMNSTAELLATARLTNIRMFQLGLSASGREQDDLIESDPKVNTNVQFTIRLKGLIIM